MCSRIPLERGGWYNVLADVASLALQKIPRKTSANVPLSFQSGAVTLPLSSGNEGLRFGAISTVIPSETNAHAFGRVLRATGQCSICHWGSFPFTEYAPVVSQSIKALEQAYRGDWQAGLRREFGVCP